MSGEQTATQQPVGRMTFSLAVLGIALFVVSLGFGIFTPILPQYATMLGIDAASLGLAYSLYNVTLAVCLIPGGVMADRIGRVKTTAIGMAVFSASSLMLVFVKDVYLFALARMIEGLGSAIVTPAVFALVADLAPSKHRGKGMGFTSTMEMVGGLAGPTLGGLVAQTSGMTTPFYLASIMSLVSGALVLLIKEQARTGPPPESSFLSIFSSLRRNVAQNRSLLVLCFRGFIIGITQGLFALVFVLYMAYRINMQPAEVGIAFTLMSGSTLAFALLAGHLSDRFGRKPFVILGGIIIGAGLVCFTFAHTMPEIYAVSIVMGLGIALNNAPINALLADCVIPDIRAKVMGGYELIVGLGRTLGVMVLGGLYAVSVTAPFNLLGGLMFVTVGLVAFFVTEPTKLKQSAGSAKADESVSPPGAGQVVNENEDAGRRSEKEESTAAEKLRRFLEKSGL